eukprot:scaffold1183_cov418-Prasinococcus_capsulatus_cf.AAC.27
MGWPSMLLLFVACLVLVAPLEAFYLPGVHPTNYRPGEKVPLKVAKLSSAKTHLPYNYYDLPFCRPDDVRNNPANLGEVLGGDITHNTIYELFMQKNETCKLLCTVPSFDSGAKYDLFAKLVEEGPYLANLRMDNMPAIIMKEVEVANDEGTQTRLVAQGKGYPIGYQDGGKFYVVNHITFWISYHELDPDETGVRAARVVGLYVTAATGAVAPDQIGQCDHATSPQVAAGDVTFTYSVRWIPSNVRWASRWDQLLDMDQQDIEMNWFAITNSLVITFCLTLMVAIILLRTLRRDVAMYNQARDALEDDTDAFEFGWKLVATDVFRAPSNPEWLSVLVGTGEQFLCMAVAILGVALLGFFSPSNRGALMTSSFVFFALLGIVAGYSASRMYKSFGGIHRKAVVLRTALFVPGIFFVVFFILDLGVWHEGSIGAVPIATFLIIIALWFGISLPLVMLGSYFGFKSKEIEMPVKPTTIPRQLPDLPWYMHTAVMTAVGGAVVFAIIFVQVFFVFTKVWLNEFVYMFGFLFAVFVIMVVASAEVSIISVYLTLCTEDYRW